MAAWRRSVFSLLTLSNRSVLMIDVYVKAPMGSAKDKNRKKTHIKQAPSTLGFCRKSVNLQKKSDQDVIFVSPYETPSVLLFFLFE
jgi:hypothetical protein